MYEHSVKSYYRLISGVDRVVGRIVAKLAEKGFSQRTVILYTGDHGFYLGERGFAGKWFPHEVSIRVPLVIYDPRLPEARRGRRCQEMALNIDLAPTMLELAGVDVPEAMQGKSLLPLVGGEAVAWRTEFFYEHLFRHGRIPCTEAVRTERHKYIQFLDTDPPYEELYDLKSDPEEAHNLAADPAHADELEQMRKKLDEWRQRAK
jgi:arylsulfatase A-like enzyme